MTEHYLDNSATTPLYQEAIQKMTDVMSSHYGNPSSLHTLGVQAEAVVAEARRSVLTAICPPKSGLSPKPEHLIFTASGTEANNLALIGAALAKERNRGKKIIIGETEHPSVREAAKHLATLGFNIVEIPSPKGVWDDERYAKELNENVILVSAMLVNNETGAVNNIRHIASMAKSVNPDVLVHCDDVQGFLKTDICPAIYADMVSVSSHKIGGPKGVGALYANDMVWKRRALSPVNFGGGQERGFRSGTENVIGIAGFGAAAAKGSADLSEIIKRFETLRSRFEERILSYTDYNVHVNRPASEKLAPHIISLTVPGYRSETLLHCLSAYGVYVSSGSACSSNTNHGDYVLRSFGLTDADADTTIRISLGVQNTEEDIDAFGFALGESLKKLARIGR